MFELVIPLGLLIALVCTGVVLWARWMVQRAANQIEERHRTAELIINDGEIPLPWIENFRKRAAKLRRRSDANPDLEAMAELARTSIGRELDRLVRYIESTRLVADEFTRETLITGINERRSEWEADGWREFVDAVRTPLNGYTAS